jgi:hypothetical protein
MLNRILAAGGLAGSSLLSPLVAGAAPAAPPAQPLDPDDDRTCLLGIEERGGVDVVDERSIRCYPTLAEAEAGLPKGSFIVATHYTGANGDGTGYAVPGTSCATTWYPSDTWQKIISSTGVSPACTGAKHYTGTNCSGSYQVTSIVLPMTTNLNGTLNNNVGCVKYS